MGYTDTVQYFADDALFAGERVEFGLPQTDRLQIDPESPVYARAGRDFSQREYLYPAPPVFLGVHELAPPGDLYALRLLIKQPGSSFIVPEKLAYLKEFIIGCATYQRAFFPAFEERFVYLTARCGEVRTNRDDEFHVDGFQGTSVPRHIPEQNYLWVDVYPTLFAIQPFFVEDLDASKHNFHTFFNARTERNFLFSGVERGLYLIDPYHVHARPAVPAGTRRSVLRLTFSPVEIRDDSNTVNPWLPRGPYQRVDVRNHLWEYPGQSPELKFGLQPFRHF